MSRKYKFWDNQRMYFISFATVNWIDVFTRDEYKDEMIKSWQFCKEKKGLNIYAWPRLLSGCQAILHSLLAAIITQLKIT